MIKQQNYTTETIALGAMRAKPFSMRTQRYHRHQQKTTQVSSSNQLFRIHHLRSKKGFTNQLFSLKYNTFFRKIFVEPNISFKFFYSSGFASNAEVRRRKRQKRQSDMEAKIKDIKRKQKESEAAAEAAPKKRRCLMIFSGVVVCVICCAYVYSKLG